MKHTGRRWPSDSIDSSTRQETPEVANNAPETGKRPGRIPLQVSEGAWPLILDF